MDWLETLQDLLEQEKQMGIMAIGMFNKLLEWHGQNELMVKQIIERLRQKE